MNIRYRQWIRTTSRVANAFWREWGFFGDEFIPPVQTTRVDPYPESFQSTGLHDSKGVEIWDGSIIGWGNGATGVVSWHDIRGCWVCRSIPTGRDQELGYVGAIGTVIGNTVEHPDMVKGVVK